MLRKGDLPVKFQWIFNAQPLVTSDSAEILNVGGRTSLLTINPIHGYHQGNFSCIASNLAGTDRVDADLIVNGIPVLQNVGKDGTSLLIFLGFHGFLV